MSRILLDVDGPLAQCVEATLAEVAPNLTAADITAWDMFSFMTKEQAKAARTLWAEHGFWAELPVVHGAHNAVMAFRDAGHEVKFVSSPYERCFGWADARREWLKKHFGASCKDFYPAPEKHMFRGDLFIDDKPEHLVSWFREGGGSPILFVMPHNQDAPIQGSMATISRLTGWTPDNIGWCLKVAKLHGRST